MKLLQTTLAAALLALAAAPALAQIPSSFLSPQELAAARAGQRGVYTGSSVTIGSQTETSWTGPSGQQVGNCSTSSFGIWGSVTTCY